MKCPNCQAPEKARVRVCQSCGHTYASEDLLFLRQLEYLLKETADWEGVAIYRKQYLERLQALKKRILPSPAEAPAITSLQEDAAVPAAPLKSSATAAPVGTSQTASVPVEKKPITPKEKVSFDQWLLSERNIKIALYSGAALLVLAGIIFIGVNWTRFSGGMKFAVTTLVTALTYFSGYLFFKRPALKLGGNALLSIACAFFALNFVVLQIYVLGPRGLPDDVMWLITSILGLALYLVTTFWTKGELFTYFSIAALGNILAASLQVASARYFVFLISFSILITILWGLSRRLKDNTIAAFVVRPLSLVSQILMPGVLIFSLLGWITETGCTRCVSGKPFIAIFTMGIGVLFYIYTEITTGREASRWASSILFTFTLAFAMTELQFSDIAIASGLMLQALAFLWIGYWLDQKSTKTSSGLPLYFVAFAVAVYITFSAFASSSDNTNLVIVLFGDVFLLGTTSFIKRSHIWFYGASWLAILPIYLLSDLLITEWHFQGLMMFGVGILYFAGGTLIGQRNLKWGGPFLTSAAILSVISVGMTLDIQWMASVVLIVWFMVYLFASIWLKWPWLFVPALVAANLAVALLNLEFVQKLFRSEAIALSYLGLGVVCWLVGRQLSRRQVRDWSWPLYLLGAVDLVISYGQSLLIDNWWVIAVSLALAILFLVYTTFTEGKLVEKIIFPLLPYIGVVLLFVAHFFMIDEFALWKNWPAITVGVCGLFAVASWLVRDRTRASVYHWPLRLGGLVLMVIPLLGALLISTAWISALVFVVCGVVYLLDSGLRRLAWMAYPGIAAVFVSHFFFRELIWPSGEVYWLPTAAGVCGLFVILSWLMRGNSLLDIYYLPFRLGGLVLMFVPLGGIFLDVLIANNFLVYTVTLWVAGTIYLGDAIFSRYPFIGYWGLFNYVAAIWTALINFNVEELQAYVFPLGLLLLGMGWYERVRYQGRFYRLFAMTGTIILLGTAFYQSLPRTAWKFALLVGIECVIAVIWGIRTHSRSMVLLGGITLIANALVQFIPGFLEWSRWMQIGLTGSILLGLGIFALFRREKLLETREKLSTEWSSWNP